MISHQLRSSLERVCCGCVVNDDSFIDDGKRVNMPTRIGGSILLFGKRKSKFPYHCMMGPDWPVVVLVYILIIAINAIILGVISPLGWPPVLIGLVGTCLLLWAFSSVACSDPGIIYKNDFTAVSLDSSGGDVEDPFCGGVSSAVGTNAVVSAQPRALLSVPIQQNTMDCGQCNYKRPYSARHCNYCKVCVDELDHHCPWCGKCIGDLNLAAFYLFLNVLCFQFYFLVGVLVYYLISTYAYSDLPSGPNFR